MIPLRAVKATAGWAGNLQNKAAGQGLKSEPYRAGLDGAFRACPPAKEGLQ